MNDLKKTDFFKNENPESSDGIVLLAKKSGPTSFSSLHSVKKALNTKKVGHTGTLDSFAQGLLVVCTGRLTKLCGKITEFDKTYDAVIKFGEETDTLEFTGNITKKTDLPSKNDFYNAIKKFTGEILQTPPLFSAIHIDGKRASDLARKGKNVQIPKRKVTVYNSKVEELKLNEKGLVEYARIQFSVSKGTYIRSLARDIAIEAGSAGHLAGLYRTSVGNFKVEDSAGFCELNDFTIENCIKNQKKYFINSNKNDFQKNSLQDFENSFLEEIRNKKQNFSEETSLLCGFNNLHLKNDFFLEQIIHGKLIKKDFFEENIENSGKRELFAIFSNQKKFVSLIETSESGKLSYKFVLN